MMIHEKMVSGQFLLDLKNERASLLNGHHHNIHELHAQHHHQQQQQQQHAALASHYLQLNHHQHHHQHLQQQTMQHQPPSPPMDIYAAYAYQQQQQQQILNNASKYNNNAIKLNHHHNNNSSQNAESKAEVLDLSRRCDSVETPRKTPSPAHTSSSVGTISPPIASPPQQQQREQQTPLIPSNLLYSMQAQQQQLAMPTPLPAALATLYPALYYNAANNIKLEPTSPNDSPNKTSTPPMPAATLPAIATAANLSPPSKATDLLHTFAAAAKSPSLITTPTTTTTPLATPPTALSNGECTSKSPTSTIGRGMPHLNMLATLEEKTTRPFKALPRDPLVIAANFAATDVLFENQRAERYKEFRKRLLEHIHNSNGGSRTVTNPKMRRTNSRSNAGSGCRSSSEERQDDHHSSKASNNGADESSDCDSNAGSFTDKIMSTNNSSNGLLEAQQQQNSNSGCSVVKDAAYLERRRKNNAAAKKSRDRRRIKEDELAMRAEFLAQENVELVCQIKALKAQLAAYTSKVGA